MGGNSVSKLIHWISLALVCNLAELVVTNRMALAQTGSIGGTVGKTEKSVSGDEEETRSHPARPGIKGRASVHASACSKLLGVWKGALGGDIIFKSGGVALGTSPRNEGTWSCNDEQLTITWKTLAAIDRCSLSADGTVQTCRHNILGNSFVRTRKTEDTRP